MCFFFINYTNNCSFYPEKDYASIPLLFEFDNYDKCMLLEEKALFCTFTFSIEPMYPERENRIWNIVKVNKLFILFYPQFTYYIKQFFEVLVKTLN